MIHLTSGQTERENELQIRKPEVGGSVKYEGKHRARAETNSKNTFFVLELSFLNGWFNFSVKEVVCVLGLEGFCCGFVCFKE